MTVRATDLTYDEVGATAGTLPGGYHHLRRSAPIGRGHGDFRRAADALLTWETHRRAGLHVEAAHPRPTVGGDVRIGIGAVGLMVPCRVVRVVEEQHVRGFAYGTLAGHALRGEESFMVVLGQDGVVRMEIVAFSRPAHRVLRLGTPLVRGTQWWLTGRYLRASRQ